jgi:hypothetical protein
MVDLSVDELKKLVLKKDFLLDKIMSVCVSAGSAGNFSEQECRALLKDIFNTWCEVYNEDEPTWEVIKELKYEEYKVRRNKKER